MPTNHKPPDQHWSRDQYSAQEVLSLVARDLNNDGVPDCLDINILGAQFEFPTEVEIKNDVGNPVPVIIVAGGGAGSDINAYAEVSSVPSAIETEIVSYTVPVGKTLYLKIVEFSGTNCADFRLKVDGNIIRRKRTYWCNFNGEFQFEAGGMKFMAGQVIKLHVLHERPDVGDFNGAIMGTLV